MKKITFAPLALAATLLFVSDASAQRGGRGAPFPTTIPSTVADGAEVVKIATLTGEARPFTEGPTTDKEGNVYFVEQNNNRIMKYDVEGNLTEWLKPTNYSNGMTFDNKGNLIACADELNELWSFDVKTKEHKVILKGEMDGKYFNAPNDVWCHPTTGRIYFTDPYYARTWWPEARKARGMERSQSVYFLEPDTGKVVRLIEGIQQPGEPAPAPGATTGQQPDSKHFLQPNGIVGTPDGKQLYVADIRAGRTYVYDILPDGGLSEGKLFCNSGSDGMTIDAEGNLYLSSGGIRVFDKTGKAIGGIRVPENPANCVFGGKDNQTLFMTAVTGFYSIKMKVKGGSPQ
jgi:gluconolactonase